MRATTQSGPLDQLQVPSGDAFFIGVDERMTPDMLPPGYVASAKNCRFTNGVIEPRGGDTFLPCMKTNGTVPWTEAYCWASYKDATGLEWILIAADGGIWRTREDNVAVQMSLPAGVTLTRETARMFVVAFDRVLLLRGPDEDELEMASMDEGWRSVQQSFLVDGAGTEAIPRASFGLLFGSRVLLIQGYDQVAVSDAFDFTRYQPVLQSFRINEGDGDRLTSILGYDKDTVLIFKQQSVYRVTGVSGDLSGAVLRNVTSQYGCAAGRSVVQFGADVAWLAEGGRIVTLRLTELNETQGRSVALSDAIPVSMRRLNRRWVESARSVAHNGRVYFALPFDDADILGENLVPSQQSYGTGTPVLDPYSGFTARYFNLTGLTAGATYRYTPSEFDFYVENGSETLYGFGEFVAQGTSVKLFGIQGGEVTATVHEVLHTGVCNAVAVFDTTVPGETYGVPGAWAGVDERSGLCIQEWLKVEVDGELQLCYLSRDGEVRVYDFGPEDETFQEVPVPYVDVVVEQRPSPGDSIQVNSGDTIVAGTSQGALAWQSTNNQLDYAASNLWSDGLTYGYDPSLSSWSAPNTDPRQIDMGVRFYSTNGSLPTVTISGDWGYKEEHSGEEMTPLDIDMDVTLRAHLMGRHGRKKYNSVLLRLKVWDPKYSISLHAEDLFSEDSQIEDQEKDPVVYDSHAQADWAPDNVNGDFETRGRQDYSIRLQEKSLTDAAQQWDGFILHDGVRLEDHQSVVEKLHLREVATASRVRIQNTQGRLVVVGCEITAMEHEQADASTVF